ncbi:hypothetical protein [Flammeovirga sp. OC4]|uniref:hypothetical protein n=1 Tax=Flammeovirga sp. OC4 TaxID=1382345 RepID=UPI0005C54DA1|nr:hypothetical protein [Flammeovirga sp. OC4]
MKTYTQYKYYFIFSFLILFSTSCSFIDEENTPEVDIQEELIPSEIGFLYNLVEPQPEDPKNLTFIYKENKIASINSLLTNNEIIVLEFQYDAIGNITKIEIKKNNITQKVYTFSRDASKVLMYKDNVLLVEAALHSNQFIYSIENFEKKQVSYYTYESSELSVKRIFDNGETLTNGTPSSIINFSYSPFGTALFSSILPVSTLFLLDEVDEFPLTQYITTSNSKVNLGSSEGVNNSSIDYRTVFNDEGYPSSISMIYRENENPVKQVIHNIYYDNVTPF